ncbi:iron uptake transporter permease EfeU [Celerinatantimonas diazotrophica]|uniref:High-affinity iron transporter n=1 Tax=Celerinatantimonas diazotrophica TaxID=412034 RepID=A0A4R1J9G4_9GAMM|nr:iron uptake transporter permease EfeU [Celerinatantimonas diazotrophica]TCK47064.1 high-affinity iron transporter [Celerinatantimonas diazotrophica]CAG9295833.1 Ferrous iron permease EfeU [Celerinatantimonas diazotrophica]
MFFYPFLIMLREGLEATLIVVLIACYLKKTGQSQWMKYVWIGVISAASLCLALGIAIHIGSGEFPQAEQELFEGIVAVIAVIMLTYMVFWMQNSANSVSITQQVEDALTTRQGPARALLLMVFLAVAREGLESVFFLLSAFSQDVGLQAPIGAVTGLATAIGMGLVLYFAGVRVPLKAFFRWTSLFILFVAAGLAAGAIRAFHEAGLWNHLQALAFNSSEWLSTQSLLGTLLESLLGYQQTPSQSEVLIYVLYLIPALTWFIVKQTMNSQVNTRKSKT